MKKRLLGLIWGVLMIAVNGLAADGDLTVTGALKVNGVYVTHVTGTDPGCASGAPVVKKYLPRTCYGVNGRDCTTPAGWGVSNTDQISCTYISTCDQYTCYHEKCYPTSWTEAICMGN
jgi:hypothetical protein